MNTKCPQCGLVNWEAATECKRCLMPLTRTGTAYQPGQWNSPYAPPPPPQFVGGVATYAPGWNDMEGMWRQNSTLVMAKNAQLPALCVKCGEPVAAADFKRRLRWHHPALYLVLLLNWLCYVIVALCVRKQATIHVGLCPTHRAKRRSAIILSWALLSLGIMLVVFGLSNDLLNLAGLGGLNILGALIYAAVAVPLVRVKKIDEHFIWLKGVDESYLAQLPQWGGDR
jgi:hypothetical protein